MYYFYLIFSLYLLMVSSFVGINKWIIINGHKLFHIGFITLIYLVFGYVYTYIFERIYGEFDPINESNKSIIIQTLELISMLWVAAIFLVIVNHTSSNLKLPNFLKINHYNYDSYINELRATGIFVFIFLFFQNHLFHKIRSNYIKLTRTTILPNL